MRQTYGALCAMAEQHGVKMTEEVRALLRAVEAADGVGRPDARLSVGWFARKDPGENYFAISHYHVKHYKQSGFDVREAFIGDDHRSVSAVRTLEMKGYTYNGAQQWRPPIGKPPVWVNVQIKLPDAWPTDEMIEAGRKAAESHGMLLGNGQSLWHVFRDMLAAGGGA